MHSSSADCVFGEARLISSTSRRFANTGPARNSKPFVRWSKTLTPVMSEGSRSGVNCRRENVQSSERASAFASIVFPTPGKSSMIRCPSLTRQQTTSLSVSTSAWTTEATFSTMRSIVCAAAGAATCCRRGLVSMPVQQGLRRVQDRCGDRSLRRLVEPLLAVARDQHDLVLVDVEADVVATHVVVDDEVDVLVGEHPALAGEAGLPRLGAEGDDHLAVRAERRELRDDVGGRLEADRPRLAVLPSLAVDLLVGTVVRDRRSHHDQVGV